MTKKQKRVNQDTTVPSVPANPADIMAALLRTPPPPAGNPATRKKATKRAAKKR